MFELTAADKAQIAESIIRDFRQKRFLREGDLQANEDIRAAFSHNQGLSDAALKEITKCKNDLRQLDSAIKTHEARYVVFSAAADAEADEADRAGGDEAPAPLTFPRTVAE